MLDTAYVYRSAREITGLYDHLFGGLFLIWGLPFALQLLVFGGLIVGIAACLKYRDGGEAKWERVVRVCAIVGFLSSALLTFHPWDELFTNLRHAEHWAQDGLFSYNRFQKIEGTVDLLFYLLVGLVSRTGLPVVEAAFSLSALGGWLIVAAARQALRDRNRHELIPPVTLAVAFFPPLLFNSASGFSATLFSAAILWSLVCALKRGPAALLYFLMAVIPLIRFEGLYWTALLAAYLFFTAPREKRLSNLAGPLAAVVPFVLITLWRLQTFGHVVPTPARFKATWGSPFFLGVGVTSLLTDLVATGTLASLVIVFLSYPRKKTIVRLLALLPLYVFPYYLTGGDWFPCYWGRFLLPVTMAAFFLAAVAMLQAKRGMVLLLLYLIPIAWPFYSLTRWAQVNFSPRWIIANPHEISVNKSLTRVHHLSQLGRHLELTTEANDVVASSEVSAVMYFAKREALDMLGVANPEIADQPLRATPSLRRKLHGRPELPHRIFRREQPDLIEKHRPAILYTFDFIPRDIMPEVAFEELDDAALVKIIRRWERRIGGLVDPLYGGFGRLTKQGYRPIVILYANKFCSLYFVHETSFARHTAKLKADGMSASELSLTLPGTKSAPGRPR